MKPLIAVVSHTEINRFGIMANNISVTYTEAVEEAGGLAMILPFTQHRELIPLLVEKADGFLFTGGMDVDPAFYGEKRISGLGQVDLELDRFQMVVLQAIMTCRKPVLAICRGIQLINVALGGSLFQDISSQFSNAALKHMQDELSYGVDHEVIIEPGSRLFDLFGPQIMVNSRHHQSIKTIGRDLIITARAPDGVIEAAQHKTLPMDLVQWHPELMLRQNNDMLCLFESFINRCKIVSKSIR
ncbi:MAG: gamma-glutamyl-gamma-aminobutyrate hydrolase family protein [Deltaproteobacteria bacterium]|nr:gamma-glutamyl-gamma-aminobutyrate hydrolase family protein [Deltaproteobacteria bacterium]